MTLTALVRACCLVPVAVLVAGLAPPGGAEPRASPPSAAERVRTGRSHAWLADLQARFPDRSPGRHAHRDAPDHIRDSLRAAGASDVRVETLETGLAWLPRVNNVIARIPGNDATRSVVLAAHHDTVGGAPGAIDDGGAVAVLVEVAHALSSGAPLACDIDIIVFDGEESGLVGSKAHVAAIGDVGRARVRAALAVELVGWKDDRLVVHTIPYGFAWDAAGIAPAWVPMSLLAAGESAGIDVAYGDPVLEPWYQPTVRLLGLGTGSDAGAYSESGIPACMLAGSSLTSFYSGYHTHRDTMDLVSSERLDDAARVTAAAAEELAARAVTEPSRSLGDVYLVVASRELSHTWLILLALGACVPGLLAARALERDGGTEAAWCLRAACVATAALAMTGGVVGVVCGVPLVIGGALAVTLPSTVSRFRLIVLLPAVLPLLVQAMVLTTASATFGFRWRGGLLGGALLVLLALTSIGTVVLVRLHRAPREPRQR